MTATQLAVPGGRLIVVDEGAGPPIVLLHAGIADMRAWDALVPLLVDAGYRAVRYDMRGFGSTETDDVPFSNRADVVAVLDALGIGQAVLVGNSRGGVIAFDTAIEYPDRVVAVVGVGAGLGGYEAPLTAEETAIFETGDALESADPPDPAAIADHDVRLWVDGPGQAPDRVPSAIREAIRAMDAAIYAPGRIDGQPIALEPRAVDRLGDLRAPVLAIAGALDVSSSSVTARYLETHAPNARAEIWPDVAHMIGMEQPERLAAAITSFVAPLDRWS
jgi:pimeloyl-ACP methyl ester carboxylesterase